MISATKFGQKLEDFAIKNVPQWSATGISVNGKKVINLTYDLDNFDDPGWYFTMRGSNLPHINITDEGQEYPEFIPWKLWMSYILTSREREDNAVDVDSVIFCLNHTLFPDIGADDEMNEIDEITFDVDSDKDEPESLDDIEFRYDEDTRMVDIRY